MDIGIRPLKQRPLVWTMLLSLLIHVLLMLLYVNRGDIALFPQPEPLSREASRQVVFEIVETPSESDRPPEEAGLFSDKDAVAQDMEAGAPAGENPFVEGHMDNRNVLIPADMQPESGETDLKNPVAEDSPVPDEKTTVIRPAKPVFSRERLLAINQAGSHSSQPLHDQREESARDLGAISLNTYAWEYAPYLLDLKRRIEKNIFPPPVFTRMGFGGRNVLKFRIMPDGTLIGPELLESSGEKALIHTSRNAVKYSAPFNPLPDDFPEEFLEVTARFDYMITGRQ